MILRSREFLYAAKDVFFWQDMFPCARQVALDHESLSLLHQINFRVATSKISQFLPGYDCLWLIVILTQLAQCPHWKHVDQRINGAERIRRRRIAHNLHPRFVVATISMMKSKQAVESWKSSHCRRRHAVQALQPPI